MGEKLLVVEDAFVARSPGVLVTPRITVQGPAERIRVRLVRPDGTEKPATASLDLAHVRGPGGQFAMYRLHGVELHDVPEGTEIWSLP